MVQIVTPTRQQRPTFAQSVLGGLAEATPAAIEKYQGLKRQKQENQAISDYLGPESKGMPREFQQMMLQGDIQRKNKSAELQKGNIEELQRYNDIKKYFGEEAAEIYRAAPEGGKTAIIQSLLENAQRGNNFTDLLGKQEVSELYPSQDNIGLTPKERATRQLEREKAERKESFEINKPLFKSLEETRRNIPILEQSIQDIKEASPEMSINDYLADITGFEPLRTERGVKFKTAVKDFFLADLTRVGARPNMWVEQQLLDALPKTGRNPEANLITAEGMQFKVDLAKKREELQSRLIDEDTKKYGFAKSDVSSRADKEMKKYVIDRQKELKDNIKKIKKDYKGVKNTFRVRSPDGSIYEIDSEDLDEALKNEFQLVK